MTYSAAIVFRDGVTRFIQVGKNEKLLDASFRQGVSLPVDCREGVCASCRGRCESGDIEMEFVDSDALSEAEINQGFMLSCQTRLKADSSFYFDVDSHICNTKKQTCQGSVTEIRQVSDAAAILEIQLTPGQDPLQYLPGQYARLQVPGTTEYRAYSFANAPDPEGRVRFLIRLLPTGVMSDYLRQRCQKGDNIVMEAPLGAFYLRQIQRPLLFVAGGTGLSAFLAMLDQLERQNTQTPPIQLYYGVNHEQDLSEQERLERYTHTLPNFRYDTAVMHPSAAWLGQKGLVTDIINPQDLDTAFDAYLCGPPAMIEGVQHWLKNHITVNHQVFFEKFTSS